MHYTPWKGYQKFVDLGFALAGFNSAANSTSIDRASHNFAHQSACVLVSAEAASTSTSLAIKIQHSDNGSTWADVVPGEHSPLSFTKTVSTAAAGLHELHIALSYLKRYFRVVATPAGGEFEGRIFLQYYNSRKEPIS